MENENDSLDRLAHAQGITDLEIEERESTLAEIASQQIIRRRMEEEEADRKALREFSENEDIDFGWHSQWEWRKSLIIKHLGGGPPSYISAW